MCFTLSVKLTIKDQSMNINIFTLILSLCFLASCQSTRPINLEKDKTTDIDHKSERNKSSDSSSNPEVNKINDISSKLEGAKFKVWKEASFKGIRNELKEGEIITFKKVEAKELYDHSGYYYLGYIYSADNKMLFDEKYSLSDVGVIDFSGYKIDKRIDSAIVHSLRGVRYHGNPEVQDGFSSTYWKSTGGDNPTAIPVQDYKSTLTNKHDVAQIDSSGLYLSCISGNVYLSFSNKDNIYAADNEDITVTVFYPYSHGKKYASTAYGFTGVSLRVDSYIGRILLKEDAIKLEAYSHSNRNFTEITAYNNGLAEAYSRVKNNCSL